MIKYIQLKKYKSLIILLIIIFNLVVRKNHLEVLDLATQVPLQVAHQQLY